MARLDDVLLRLQCVAAKEGPDAWLQLFASEAKCLLLALAERHPLKETQLSISEWAEETFGPSGSNARAIARANEEMAELIRHAASDDRHSKIAEEIADIVIVLMRVCTRVGASLHDEINKKMARNRIREWRRDGTGHGYHKKEEGV